LYASEMKVPIFERANYEEFFMGKIVRQS